LQSHIDVKSKGVIQVDNGVESTSHPVSHLCVHLLGTFSIELNNVSIRLPTRKIETLLAYLILHPGKQTREKLSALLWGDSSQADARASLRQALAILRRQIDKNIVLADREYVQANSSFPSWVDTLEFEEKAQRFLAEQSLPPEPFDDELYPGDLLPEYYDNWILSLREHYRTLYIDVMLRSVEQLRARSEYARAIEYAHRILDMDAANEYAHQHLMFCYITSGDRQKALQQYEACQIALREEFEVEPARETRALFHWIKESSPSIPIQAAKITNLPIPISSFVGRARELTQIKQLVSTKRLVTLTGAGGSGKTRLAIHAATDLIDAYQEGVWWVELAHLSEASLVPYAVASALGMEVETQQSITEAIIHFLRTRKVLLVLDNCEHLIAASAQLVDALLHACEKLKILATSREALRVKGEQVWAAPTLSVPESAAISEVDQVMRSESVQLFVERTRAVRSEFVLSEGNVMTVAQICQRLDGIPLAIELAAARMKMMSTDQIAARLDDRFGLLTSSARIPDDRHRTLRAVVDWSYDLLSEDERLLFNRLSVFAGGWTIETAEAICSGEGIQAKMVLDLLAHLVDKSLISVDRSGERYTMLETMKAYGLEKLAETGQQEWIVQRHLDYFLELAETADKKLRDSEQLTWLGQVKREPSNLNIAIERSLNNSITVEKGIRLVCAMAYYWGIVGDVNTSRYWLGKAVNESEPLGRTATRARILFNMGYWSAFTLFELSASEQQVLLEASLDIWNKLGEDYLTEKAKCLMTLGYILKKDFNDDRGFTLLNESIEIFRERQQTWWQAWALHVSTVMYADSPPEEIRRILEKEDVLWHEIGDRIGLANQKWDLGALALKLGDYNGAEKCLQDSLALFEEMDSRGFIIQIFRDLGSVMRGLKQYDQAEWYYKECIPYIALTGMDFRYSITYLGLGFIALRKSNPADAEKYLFQTLEVSLEMEIKERIILSIGGFAALEVLRGNLTRAARYFGIYSAHYEAFEKLPRKGLFSCPVTIQDIEHFLRLCQGQLEYEAFEPAWNTGKALTLDDAVEEIRSSLQRG
jgi:predicted ATPase/DNA-binding SARP family transcriptional activator